MIDPVINVIDEVRLLNHRLIALVEDLHRNSGVSAPQRAVLEFLDRHGPATVPSIARARGVTRQHIQTIVNELRALGLTEPQENPAHVRSPMFSLTDTGVETIEGVLERERDHLTATIGELDEHDLRTTARTLAELRHALRKGARS
jgi:DNA-binding MarR family transcriptional regulator